MSLTNRHDAKILRSKLFCCVPAAYCSVPGTLEDVCSRLNHKSAYYTLVKGY